MSLPVLREGLRRGARTVPWPLVAVLAVLLSLADAFVLVSVEGAVGAIERAQEPFTMWLQHSAAMVPVFAVTVVAALAVARRRLGRSLRTWRQVLGAAAVVVLAGTLVGTAWIGASVAWDYHLQSQLLDFLAANHQHLANDRETTAAADLKAVRYAGVVVLAANAVLVPWVVALFGGRLDAVRRRRAVAPA
jgi:hypothetical protein